MSTKPGLNQANQGSESLSQDPTDLNQEQDGSAQAAADAQGVPSATGTGTIKVTG
jgi:hypothetical protein